MKTFKDAKRLLLLIVVTEMYIILFININLNLIIQSTGIVPLCSAILLLFLYIYSQHHQLLSVIGDKNNHTVIIL